MHPVAKKSHHSPSGLVWGSYQTSLQQRSRGSDFQGISTEAPTSNFQRVHGREGQANFFFSSPSSVKPDDCLAGSHPGKPLGPVHKHSSLNPVPNWHLPAEIYDLNISFGVLPCSLYHCKNDYKRIIFICLFVTSSQISRGNLDYFDTCRQVNEKMGRLICPRGVLDQNPLLWNGKDITPPRGRLSELFFFSVLSRNWWTLMRSIKSLFKPKRWVGDTEKSKLNLKINAQ